MMNDDGELKQEKLWSNYCLWNGLIDKNMHCDLMWLFHNEITEPTFSNMTQTNGD